MNFRSVTFFPCCYLLSFSFFPIHVSAQIDSSSSIPDHEVMSADTMASNSIEQGSFLTEPVPGESNGSYRIMVMGNSITVGYGDGSAKYEYLGYRKKLYDLLKQNHYEFDFVGREGDKPYEGHFQGATKIYDFYPKRLDGRGRMNVEIDCMSDPKYLPNIVTIHLGTNDLNSDPYDPIVPYSENGILTNTKTGQMATLISFLLKWNNGEYGTHLQKIIVSQLVPIVGSESSVISFNIEVARMVNDFQNGLVTGNPEPVYLCDHLTPFMESSNYSSKYMFDDLHPNAAGYTVMAQSFFKEIKQLLDGQQTWFANITWKSGIAGPDHKFSFKGIAVCDITGDGRDDIYLCRSGIEGSNAREFFYASQNSLPYSEKAGEFLIQDPGTSHAALFVDIDNDGDYDLFNGNVGTANKLYENIGNNTFHDISAQSNIANVNRVTKSIVAFDCENDGDMDILALNATDKNEFYVNRGNGSYDLYDRGLDDQTTSENYRQSASAADFDNDGDVDIYITKRNLPNKLFVNDGQGFFTDQAQQAGVALTHESNGALWGDLDNDGDMDLLVTVSSMSNDRNPLLRVYQSNGDGTFQDLTASVKIPMNGYSALAADFDNDGDLDIITTGETSTGGFYRNEGAWQFAYISNTGAEIQAGDVRGAAILDYDDDGDMDFLATRADVFNVFMQNNLDNGNNFIKFAVFGPHDIIGGFGTKISIYKAGNLGDPYSLIAYREAASSTCFISQSSPVVHAGVGNDNVIDVLAQFSNGEFLALRNLTVNQTVSINPQGKPQPFGPASAIVYQSGNLQSKQVAQELDEPVVVKVIDDQGQSVAGANVTFKVKSGDARLFVRDAVSETVWMEAENGQFGGSLRWSSDQSASGYGFAYVPSTAEIPATDTLNSVIPVDSIYYLWLRYINTIAASTMEISIEDENSLQTTLPQTQTWQWHKALAAGFALKTGNRTLVLQTDSHNFQLDRILLTPDVNYIPDGMGQDAAQSPYATDRDGLARRHVLLGYNAGRIRIESELQLDGQPVNGSPVIFSAQALPGPATTLNMTSGNNQIGQQDVALSEPFVVTVSDMFHNPVPNIPVQFTVISGTGTIQPSAAVLTDTTGQAKATLTPGNGSIQQVKAEANGLIGSPLIFTVNIPGTAFEIKYLSGSQQTGIVMIKLPKPVQVQILSQSGNPCSNYSVIFKVISGEGRLSPNATGGQTGMFVGDTVLNAMTDAQGLAQVFWQLGPKSGIQELLVEAVTLKGSPLHVQAFAVADKPAIVAYLSGNNQQAPVTCILPIPFKVRVLDAWGNPDIGQDVSFICEKGGGTINGGSAWITRTDNEGDAHAFFKLGTRSGKNIYTVHAVVQYNGQPVPGSPVEFISSALPGPAVHAEKLTYDDLIDTVGQTLSVPFKIKVTDAYSNPIEDFSIPFSVISGDGSLNGLKETFVKTNPDGIAETYLTLGPAVGIQQVKAFCQGLQPENILFSVKAVADHPFSLIYISGNLQRAVIQTRLDQPFVVQVTDQYYNPLQGQIVRFTVTSEQGNFDGGRSISVWSDVNGRASAYLILGSNIGDSAYHVEATSSCNEIALQGSPIVFYAGGDDIPQKQTFIEKITTEALTGYPSTLLDKTLMVRITDSDHVPINNHPVAFTSSDSVSIVTPQPIYTDESGIAGVQVVLGSQPGRCKVQAYATASIGSPVYFPIAIMPRATLSMHLTGGNGQTGVAGHMLKLPLEAKVADSSGNGVAQIAVTFMPDSGHGRVVPANTLLSDHLGLVRVNWILGPSAGTQLLSVFCEKENIAPVAVQASASVNFAPFLSIPDSLTLKENNVLSFAVLAMDPEGDTISVTAKNLPVGAEFDSLKTREFRWRPSFDQAGIYLPVFLARDHIGAGREKTLRLVVENINRAPHIVLELSLPLQHQLDQLQVPDAVNFLVVASDEDKDPLYFLWLVNNAPKSTTAGYFLQSQLYEPGFTEVKALVYDMEDTAATSWTFDIIAGAELTVFQGCYQPFEGNILSWKINSEYNPREFLILRASNTDGPFDEIGRIGQTRQDHRYRFIDSEVNAGTCYFYKIRIVQNDGLISEHETIRIDTGVPLTCALEQNFPNPFNSSTTILFAIPEHAHVILSIFDITGKQVRALVDQDMNPGYHRYEWDGLDKNQFPAAAGVYFFILSSGQTHLSRKMALLR